MIQKLSYQIKRIQQRKINFSDISGLYDLKDSNIAFPEYPDFIIEDDKTLINYEKNLNFVGKSPFLIDINKPEIKGQNIDFALEVHSRKTDYPMENLALPKNINEEVLTSGDRIMIGFVESTDYDLVRDAVMIYSFKKDKLLIL